MTEGEFQIKGPLALNAFFDKAIVVRGTESQVRVYAV